MEEMHTLMSEEKSSEEKPTQQSRESVFGFLVMIITVILFFVIVFSSGWFVYYGAFESRLHSNQVSIEDIPLGTKMGEEQKEMKTEEEQKGSDTQPVKPDASAVNKKISIKVLNGSSLKGVAGTAAKILTDASYTAVTAGNAKGNYTGTTIYFTAPATKVDADAVKSVLAGRYPSGIVKSSLPGTADTIVSPITVIIGQ